MLWTVSRTWAISQSGKEIYAVSRARPVSLATQKPHRDLCGSFSSRRGAQHLSQPLLTRGSKSLPSSCHLQVHTCCPIILPVQSSKSLIDCMAGWYCVLCSHASKSSGPQDWSATDHALLTDHIANLMPGVSSFSLHNCSFQEASSAPRKSCGHNFLASWTILAHDFAQA